MRSTDDSHTRAHPFVSVVIHPNPIFREGLTSVLAKSPFAPARTVASADDVPRTICHENKQLLILFGVLEGSDLAEALSATKASFPDAHIVVIGDASKRDDVTTALALGVASFVDENVAACTLIKKLELVALGEPVISVFLLKQLLGHCYARPCEKAVALPAVDEPRPLETLHEAEASLQLSGREAAILNGLVQGSSNKVIAYQLKISEATVKVHVKAILRKIRVRNRTQAAIWALHHQTQPKRLAAANAGPLLPPPSLAYAMPNSAIIASRPAENAREGEARP